VNIGPRQKGRLRALSVLDCAENKTSIVEAIARALSTGFKATFEKETPPYVAGNASLRIKEKLKGARLDNIIMKKFYDLK
jgi:UDP-N-acetylglucosamine 2-epimerase